MERRLNTKFEDYITSFKNGIRDKINELGINEVDKTNELMGFIYDYERLVFHKDDICKRKRVKNTVPVINRCSAKRANGEQCTRRRKDNLEYCGTHVKGTPHGLASDAQLPENLTHKVEVIAQEIGGIVYYIDNYNNVYNTEDIMNEKQNPGIVAQYIKQNNTYSIPELGV
tara:strand:- start:2034 stop:2546 length:513 start_codon:yes stop_codon:yes gene_type:complete